MMRIDRFSDRNRAGTRCLYYKAQNIILNWKYFVSERLIIKFCYKYKNARYESDQHCFIFIIFFYFSQFEFVIIFIRYDISRSRNVIDII